MLDHLSGKIISIDSMSITLEMHGMGLKLFSPTNDLATLPPIGQKATLFTALFFKEPKFELFGFLQKETRDLFYQLTQISGIGPKIALQVLSVMRLSELFAAIHAEDAMLIARVPGIGKKTAQRLILEMKSKVPNIPTLTSHLSDALLALQKLGFHETIAKKALDKVYKENKKAKVDELITQSLKHLS